MNIKETKIILDKKLAKALGVILPIKVCVTDMDAIVVEAKKWDSVYSCEITTYGLYWTEEEAGKGMNFPMSDEEKFPGISRIDFIKRRNKIGIELIFDEGIIIDSNKSWIV